MGIKGQGVRVGIFDTGIDEDHKHFKRARIIDYTNWTNEPNAKDTIGHGTFVAGMFVSDPNDDRCDHYWCKVISQSGSLSSKINQSISLKSLINQYHYHQ